MSINYLLRFKKQFPRFKGGNEEDSQEAQVMYHRYSRKSRSRDKTVFLR